MKCPNCNNTKGVAIDIHSDGYAKEILECSSCGTVWLASGSEIIKKAA
jgi:hypothetical protein